LETSFTDVNFINKQIDACVCRIPVIDPLSPQRNKKRNTNKRAQEKITARQPSGGRAKEESLSSSLHAVIIPRVHILLPNE